MVIMDVTHAAAAAAPWWAPWVPVVSGLVGGAGGGAVGHRVAAVSVNMLWVVLIFFYSFIGLAYPVSSR